MTDTEFLRRVKIAKRIFAWGAYSIPAFYVPIWIAHLLFPKWWDLAFGLPFSFMLLYYGAKYFSKTNDGK